MSLDPIFQFDGIAKFYVIERKYFPHDKTFYCSYDGIMDQLKEHVWSRITLPIHALVAISSGAVRQSLRAAVLISTGILTGNINRLKIACIDVLSILIQLIVLPILIVLSFFAPTFASKLAENLLQSDVRHHRQSTLNVNLLEPIDLELPTNEICREARALVRSFIVRVVSPIEFLLSTVSDVAHTILILDAREMVGSSFVDENLMGFNIKRPTDTPIDTPMDENE